MERVLEWWGEALLAWLSLSQGPGASWREV